MGRSVATRRPLAMLILLAALALCAPPPVPGEPEREALAARLEREADAALDRLAGPSGFSGVILVARDGAPLVRKAYGFADWIRRVPNTPQTRFMIFSSTKQLTAAATLRLADRGMLSLRDPVASTATAGSWSGRPGGSRVSGTTAWGPASAATCSGGPIFTCTWRCS